MINQRDEEADALAWVDANVETVRRLLDEAEIDPRPALTDAEVETHFERRFQEVAKRR